MTPFSGFLAKKKYGWSRFKYPEIWPSLKMFLVIFLFLEGDHPLLFVETMTFILIMAL